MGRRFPRLRSQNWNGFLIRKKRISRLPQKMEQSNKQKLIQIILLRTTKVVRNRMALIDMFTSSLAAGTAARAQQAAPGHQELIRPGAVCSISPRDAAACQRPCTLRGGLTPPRHPSGVGAGALQDARPRHYPSSCKTTMAHCWRC